MALFYIFCNSDVWLCRRSLDSCLCFCIQSLQYVVLGDVDKENPASQRHSIGRVRTSKTSWKGLGDPRTTLWELLIHGWSVSWRMFAHGPRLPAWTWSKVLILIAGLPHHKHKYNRGRRRLLLSLFFLSTWRNRKLYLSLKDGQD